MNASFFPHSTPRSLKILLFAILALSLLPLSTDEYLNLSAAGIRKLYLWQFATYLFSFPFPEEVIHLCFNVYLLWIFGTGLLERMHSALFYSLFFGASISAGLIAWGAMCLMNSSLALMGSSPALYAVLISWIILNPEGKLFIFFSIPFKARHLILVLIAIHMLIDVSHSNWIDVCGYLGGAFFGYLFTIICCRVRSPFLFLGHLENGILFLVEKITHLGKPKPVRHAKVYDIKSGQPILSDEQFMDAMLARISLYGEDSLTPEEKKRMQRISEKKSAEKK